jgi:hypothetical protein
MEGTEETAEKIKNALVSLKQIYRIWVWTS